MVRVESAAAAERAAVGMPGSVLRLGDGPRPGCAVTRVLAEEWENVEAEAYLGLVLDCASGGFRILASGRGGAGLSGSETRRFALNPDPASGEPSPGREDEFVGALGLPARFTAQARLLLRVLKRFFFEKDCVVLDINPLAALRDGRLVVLDANALYRHPEPRRLALSADRAQGLVRPRAAGRVCCVWAGIWDWSRTGPAWPWPRRTRCRPWAGGRRISATSGPARTRRRSKT